MGGRDEPHRRPDTTSPSIAAFEQRKQQTTPSNTGASTQEGYASGTLNPSDTAWVREALIKNTITPNSGLEGIRRPQKTTIEAGPSRVTHSTRPTRRTTPLNLTTYFPSPCMEHKRDRVEKRMSARTAISGITLAKRIPQSVQSIQPSMDELVLVTTGILVPLSSPLSSPAVRALFPSGCCVR